MYSNNIVNFQESTTILNACTKKSGNLLKAPRTSSILQGRFFSKTLIEKWTKSCTLLFPLKSNFETQRMKGTQLLLLLMFIMLYFLILYSQKSRKFLVKIRTVFEEINQQPLRFC